MILSPFELEIFHNVLSSIAEEMGVALIRASFSPNIKERRDLSCAIFQSNGDMIAQAAHVPIHLGSMSFAVKSILSDTKINEGDIFIINDPFRGGTHLPDITCIAPVTFDNKFEFFVASRAHHADVGGLTPGSMPLSTSIEQEGILISPSKLYKKGKLNKALFKRILNSTRDPEEREGDLRAQVGALDLGRKRLRETVGKYSLSQVKEAGSTLLDYSEKIMKQVISDIPDGTYKFEDYMDDDGAGATRIPIKLALTIKGERAVANFRGSSKMVKGCLNAPYSVTTSAVIYVFQCLAPPELPFNVGPLRVIDVIVDEDSILSAKYPAAVAGGNVETSQRVVDVVFGALSKAIPEKIPAASSGSMSNFTFGGVNPRTGKAFAYYETIAGGMGARCGMDGVSAVQTHMTNTLNTPIEALERELPVMINSYSIKRGSGGKGEFNGGDSIIREYKFLSQATVSIITERRKFSPYGVKGGEAAKMGRNSLIKQRKTSLLDSKSVITVDMGDIIRIQTPGGGGWGKNSL